ncbi:50S ribosomal protein L24 [Chlamydiifrater phoenicopteri]|uniref:50S ribosomal protein L24 n=1 Tax=Chlamydiifrater phoenicopteri TaxID=2681469 RepID=UPI001BD0A40A|nr:50S ribosomal protein L24 [Chlamydiifrater phoenicopteri]
MGKKTIRKGDVVQVISGNAKGSVGKVLAFSGDRVTVEGVNVRVKNIRKSQDNPKGKRISIEAPVHISNIRLSIDGNPAKLSVRYGENGQKELWQRSPDGSEALYRVVRERKLK